MQAGKLRHLVTIQQRSAARDAAGQPALTWVNVATVHASIFNHNGIQAIKADVDESTSQTSIRVRWIVGITAGMRIVHGSDIYDIRAVLPDADRRRHIDFVCEIGASNG